MTTVTYKHQTAGSVIHLQKPQLSKDAPPNPVKTITFGGPKGGVGFYSTSNAEEIAALDYLAAHPQVQVERVEAELAQAVEAAAPSISKPADPAIAQAAEEVVETAARSADPAVVSAAERLAATIAANKNS